MIFLIFSVALPSSSFAQRCQYVEDASGRVDSVIKLDGKVFFLMTEEEAKSLAKKVESLDLSMKEVELLKSKSDLLEKKIIIGEDIIKYQDSMIQIDRETIRRMNDLISPPPWYMSPTIHYVGGFVTAILGVALINVSQ